MSPCGKAKESRSHIVGGGEMYNEERDALEIRKVDECDTEKNIRACRTAMAASMNFDTSMRGDNYYKLRKIRGTNLQKLTFISSKKTGRKTIICSVKRREVLELTDEKKRSLN